MLPKTNSMLVKERIAKRIHYKGLKLSTTKKDDRLDIRDLISQKVEKEGISKNWLAEKIGMTYQHFYMVVFMKKANLPEEKLDLINEALNTDY